MMTSSERAEQIRDRALKEVADRITALGAEFHPAAIPIVAANVAMHVMADELLDDISDPSITILGHIARLTAWGPGEQQFGPAGHDMRDEWLHSFEPSEEQLQRGVWVNPRTRGVESTREWLTRINEGSQTALEALYAAEDEAREAGVL